MPQRRTCTTHAVVRVIVIHLSSTVYIGTASPHISMMWWIAFIFLSCSPEHTRTPCKNICWLADNNIKKPIAKVPTKLFGYMTIVGKAGHYRREPRVYHLNRSIRIHIWTAGISSSHAAKRIIGSCARWNRCSVGISYMSVKGMCMLLRIISFKVTEIWRNRTREMYPCRPFGVRSSGPGELSSLFIVGAFTES